MNEELRLFEVPPVEDPAPDGYLLRPRAEACAHCGVETRWVWSPVAKVWLCDGYTSGARGCGKGQGSIERLATPDEVDDGCELGITWDPVGGWPPQVRRPGVN